MREIKFRAWDEAGRMLYDFQFMKSGDGAGDWIVFMHKQRGLKQAMNDPHPRQRFILMQFTGLKDKNGKEIYENDILRDKDGDLYTVENWGDSVFRIVYNTITWEWLFQAYAKGLLKDEIEVIGNIYENPELLNSEQSVQESDTTESK